MDLSKSLNIGEVEALRIVVLEHQERPAVGLVNSGASDSSTDNVFGGGYAEAQLRVSQLISDEEKKKNLFVKRLEVYLQERRYVVKTAAFLVRAAMSAERPENVWRAPGRKFLAEGVMRRGGITTDVVGSIAKRWRNDKDGDGLPQWVKERLGLPEGEGVAFQWELQVCIGDPQSLRGRPLQSAWANVYGFPDNTRGDPSVAATFYPLLPIRGGEHFLVC